MNVRWKLTYTILVLGSMLCVAISPLNAQTDNYGARVDAIIDAVRKGDLTEVKTLVEEDPRLANARVNNGGRSLIQIAAEQVVWHRPKHREIVLYLANNGADYDIFTAARAGLLDAVSTHAQRNPQSDQCA